MDRNSLPAFTVSRPFPGPWATCKMLVLAFWGSPLAPLPSKGMPTPLPALSPSPELRVGRGSELLPSSLLPTPSLGLDFLRQKAAADDTLTRDKDA